VKVLAALSGGVDSSVAAARARAAGHDVVGIHLALSKAPESFRNGARGCCTLEDSRDARRTADILGIPFYVWDLSDQFHRDVIDDFVSEYEAGRTPNPCIRCNERIKFAAVLERSLSLGFDAVCTGHYARIVEGSEGRELHRAVDEGKDQSYVLGGLSPAQLAHSLFPLGDSLKSDVRREAAQRGLLVAEKPDSHDLCFISDGNTRAYLQATLGRRPGRIVDADGVDLAGHDGAYAYTVGQRRGLSLADAGGDGRPRYVLSIEPVSGTVTVGPRESLQIGTVHAQNLRWCGARPAADSFPCLVQVRAHGSRQSAIVDHGETAVTVRLDESISGVAPGQTLVMYEDTRVLGAATVTATGGA
jgi:tRNA-uridine 2-sulfurtransferase